MLVSAAAGRCRLHLAPTSLPSSLPPLFSPVPLTAAYYRNRACAAACHQLRRRPPATLPSLFPLLPDPSPGLDCTCTATQGRRFACAVAGHSRRRRLVAAIGALAINPLSLTRPPPTPLPTRPPTSLTQPSPAPSRALVSHIRRRHELRHRPLPPAGSSLLAVFFPPRHPPPHPSSLTKAPYHSIVTYLRCFCRLLATVAAYQS